MPQVNLTRIQEIYQAIERHPGSTAREIGDRLGLSYNQVRAALPTLEYRGFLLAEDDTGHLRAYSRIDVVAQMHRIDNRIRRMHARGYSINEIGRALLGRDDGGAHRRIARVIPG